MELITPNELARRAEVDTKAADRAVHEGTVPSYAGPDGAIRVDWSDPAVQEWASRDGRRKRVRTVTTPAELSEWKPVQVGDVVTKRNGRQAVIGAPRVRTAARPRHADDEGVESQMQRAEADRLKAVAQAALNEIKRQQATLEFAERLGAIIDIDTLRKKFGAFVDYLMTHLIYMPEDLADKLWVEAKASPDPPRTIRQTLSRRIEDIIKEGKAAAARITPPDTGSRQYLIIDQALGIDSAADTKPERDDSEGQDEDSE